MFKNLTKYLLILNMLQVTPMINSGTGFSQSAEAAKDKAAAAKRAEAEIAKMAISKTVFTGELPKAIVRRPGTPHLSHKAVTTDGIIAYPMPPLEPAPVQAVLSAPASSGHAPRFVDIIALAVTAEFSDGESTTTEVDEDLVRHLAELVPIIGRKRAPTAAGDSCISPLASESLPAGQVYVTKQRVTSQGFRKFSDHARSAEKIRPSLLHLIATQPAVDAGATTVSPSITKTPS